MWSLGIIMYILLTGKAPYFGNDDDRIISQVKKGSYNKKLLIDSKISKQAQTLIDKLLNKDYKQRLTADEALQDPWIQKRMHHSGIDQTVQLDIMNNLKGFNAQLKLQQAVLTLMVHQLMPADEMEDQKRVFTALDKNNDGLL